MTRKRNKTGRHFNELTPAEDERLALLAEECAEVIQAITKIQRHGYDSANPVDGCAPPNREALAREIGDVRAAIEMLVRAVDVDAATIELAYRTKLESVKRWLHHQNDDEGTVRSG